MAQRKHVIIYSKYHFTAFNAILIKCEAKPRKTQLGRAVCCFMKSDADLRSGQDPLTNPGKIRLTGTSEFGSSGYR